MIEDERLRALCRRSKISPDFVSLLLDEGKRRVAIVRSLSALHTSEVSGFSCEVFDYHAKSYEVFEYHTKSMTSTARLDFTSGVLKLQSEVLRLHSEILGFYSEILRVYNEVLGDSDFGFDRMWEFGTLKAIRNGTEE